MKHAPAIYTMEDLMSITGLTRRTIRLWVQKGVIPPSPVRGREGPHWSEEHLQAIRRVQKIREQQVTLDDLAERFGYREDARA